MVNQAITEIYENYLDAVNKATAKDVHRFGGLSRIFTGRQSYVERLLPDFDDKLGTTLRQLYQTASSSAEVRELAEWMVEQVYAHKDDQRVKYHLMAQLRHLTPLVGALNSTDAASLAERLEAAFPRRERFPIHMQLITKLKELT